MGAARSRAAWAKYLATRVLALVLDTGFFALAYAAAFALRFDFQEPIFGWRAVALAFVTVWGVQVAAFAVTGCAWRAWRTTGVLDLPRFAAAFFLSAGVLTLMRYFLPSNLQLHIRPPYTITLISTVLAFLICVGARLLWRAYTKAAQEENLLLNRGERLPDVADVVSLVGGRTVMITGAGGSIGSEIVRQVVRAAPAKVVLVERSENALYEIDRELRELGLAANCVNAMVDVNDVARMTALLEAHRPAVLLHAAAYKHVPMVEANPIEGLRNNALATRRLGELARAFGVERFTLVSTDKAVNPASVMGATKRLAEILLMDLNADGGTRFSAVRFGNVLGSSGSVVPLFEDQIRRRRPITVTHPDMRRYFMTVQEAVGLVLKASAFARGGEIFVLAMGEPVKIVDLAEQMVRRAGLRPYVDIPIVFTGIRPGEKLFEELDVSEKSAFKTGHARIFICREPGAHGNAEGLLAKTVDIVGRDGALGIAACRRIRPFPDFAEIREIRPLGMLGAPPTPSSSIRARMCLVSAQYLGCLAFDRTEVLIQAYRGIGPSVPRYWCERTEVLVRAYRGIGPTQPRYWFGGLGFGGHAYGEGWLSGAPMERPRSADLQVRGIIPQQGIGGSDHGLHRNGIRRHRRGWEKCPLGLFNRNHPQCLRVE